MNCFFSHPSAAPSGDGSLRKLTDVAQGAERLSSIRFNAQTGTTMNDNWKESYQAALVETDDKKLRERIQAAKAAIDGRLRELQMDHGGTPEERQAITAALD